MDLQKLWEDYRNTQDAQTRERLLLHYLPLVKIVAGRMKQTLPQAVQLADLEGTGARGLIQAIDGYDHNRGIKFESYASLRIRGAILDGLREYDWLPRSIRSKSKSLERAFETCECRQSGIPDDADVAEEMGISIDDYYQLLEEVGSLKIVSLDSEPEGADGAGSYHEIIPDYDVSDPLENLQHEEEKQLAVKWLEELPERMRQVMVLYYYEELTLKEIGEVLNLSESRICQIHTSAIHSIRARLQLEHVA